MASLPQIDRAQLVDARASAAAIHVAPALNDYVLDIARATRQHAELSLGLSTRGALALLRAARVAAGVRGGEFVSPDDVKEVADWVIAHRIVLLPEAGLDGVTDRGVIAKILSATAVPR